MIFSRKVQFVDGRKPIAILELAENGGHVLLTKDWTHYSLVCMGYVKRRANSKVKITVENFEELRYSIFCIQYCY